MGEPQYRIDDEGNLVQEGGEASGAPSQNGAGAQEEEEDASPLTREQARGTVRALILSEVLGVLMLLGGAVYYEEQRTLLLIGAAVYAVVAFFAASYLRRSIYKRVEDNRSA